MNGEKWFSNSDIKVIRSLAKRVANIADLSKMKTLKNLWKRHNMLESTRPLVLVYPEGSWRELIPISKLVCTDNFAREIEWKLRARIYRYENIHDDMVIEKKWIVSKKITDTGWGIEPERKDSASEFIDTWELVTNIGGTPKIWDSAVKISGEAHGFDPTLNNKKDLQKITLPKVSYNEHETMVELQKMEILFGDILDVELRGIDHISFHLMQQYTELRGLTEMMIDMYDNPELLHEAMHILSEGHQSLIDQYENQNLLSLNSNETYQGTGGVGYTDELPGNNFDPNQVKARDMWGAAEAQETTSVSPEMFSIFVLPYEKKLLEKFGLSSYGCCEDITSRIESIRTIKNLRRISISPWANLEVCADKIQNHFIFSWKPNPSQLIGTFDLDQIKTEMREGLEIVKGCHVEIILKDINTIENDPMRLNNWTELVKTLIE